MSQAIIKTNQAIFSKSIRMLTTRAIRYICERISAHASLTLPDEEKFHLAPYMLRHTFLKKVADKHGVHIGQKMSGNASIPQIFGYTKPSQSEIDKISLMSFIFKSGILWRRNDKKCTGKKYKINA